VLDCGVVESCAGIRREERQQDVDMPKPVLLAIYRGHPVNRLKGALDRLQLVHRPHYRLTARARDAIGEVGGVALDRGRDDVSTL